MFQFAHFEKMRGLAATNRPTSLCRPPTPVECCCLASSTAARCFRRRAWCRAACPLRVSTRNLDGTPIRDAPEAAAIDVADADLDPAIEGGREQEFLAVRRELGRFNYGGNRIIEGHAAPALGRMNADLRIAAGIGGEREELP